MPAMITDTDHICTLCGEHLSGCDLCGSATVVRVRPESKAADDQELAQQERAIRRAADMRQGYIRQDS